MTPLPILSKAVAKCDKASELVQVWQKRISFQTEEEKAAANKVPKTVLSVVPAKMNELLSGSANPMFDEECGDLATEFILDHVSKYAFDPKNPDLINGEGLHMKVMSGKKLIFGKDTGLDRYLVNDIEVASMTTLDDGTVVMSIEGFLFNHDDEIKAFMKETSNKPGLRSRIKSLFKSDDKGEE